MDLQDNKLTFNHRGKDMTRLETFTDASFAFAITMLVISVGKIPSNYEELILALKRVPSFAFSFASIIWFWFGHRRWSRRFGIEDNISIVYSLALVFVMLVYVYPLRLIFSSLFNWITGGWLPSEFFLYKQFELNDLFIVYGIGFFALSGSLVLLNWHALKCSDKLRLTDFEKLATRYELTSWLLPSITGLASALYAWIMPANIAVWAGFVYTTLGISMPLQSFYYEKRIKALREKSAVNDPDQV